MFPISLRSITGAFGAATQWLSSFAATMSAPHMQAAVGGYVFVFYGICCFATLVFTFVCIPETKGTPVESMAQLFGTSNVVERRRLLTPLQVDVRVTASGARRRFGHPTVFPLPLPTAPCTARPAWMRRQSTSLRSECSSLGPEEGKRVGCRKEKWRCGGQKKVEVLR